jgi:hypothetical protein
VEEVHWKCFQDDKDFTQEDVELYALEHSDFFSIEEIEHDWPMIDFSCVKAGDRVVVTGMDGKCASCYEHHFPCLECNCDLKDAFYASSLSFTIMSHNEYAATFHFGPRGLAPRLNPRLVSHRLVPRLISESRERVVNYTESKLSPGLVRSQAYDDLPSLVKESAIAMSANSTATVDA